MKKIFGLLTVGLVCLLSACSFLYTLDVEGNATITVDKIEMNVSNYTYNALVSTVTVEFTNTSDEAVEFNLEKGICTNGDNEKSVIMTASSLSSLGLIDGKLGAGKSVTYTFVVTFVDGENADDYKISYTFNEKELYIQLKVK